MIKFAGSITYIIVTPTDDGRKVSFDVQALATITKGLLDYSATPDWQTVWRLYDETGRLIWEDARHHSIMPFSQADSASDSFNFEVDKSGSIYTFQLYGRIAGETQFIAQQAIEISTNTVVPPPTPVPLPPSPVPLPTPTPPDIPIPIIGGISLGVVLLAGLALFLVLRK